MFSFVVVDGLFSARLVLFFPLDSFRPHLGEVFFHLFLEMKIYAHILSQAFHFIQILHSPTGWL